MTREAHSPPGLCGSTAVMEAAEACASISVADARELTDRIKFAVDGTWLLVKQAYETRAWAVLGYSSWDDYCTREFGSARIRLPREERQEVVASLRESGLSIRAIAAATGTSDQTIQRDLRRSESLHLNASVSPSSPDEGRGVGRREDPGVTSPGQNAPAPQTITGTDGKRYTPPAPAPKPRRSPLADDARNAGWQFRKSVERLVRIAEDDRFTSNKEQVAAELAGHLLYAIEVCQDLLDTLKESK